VTLPSAAGTLATTTGTGSVFTNPTINGFTGDTSAITIGTTQFVKDTSGNIGIGTASPAAGVRLNISDAKAKIQVTSTTGTNAGYITFSNTGGNVYYGVDNSAGTDFSAAYAGVMWNGGAYPLVFGTSNTEKMRLDASGNLGLGATPYSTNGKNLHVKSTSAPARLILECTEASGHYWFQQSANDGSLNWYDATASRQAMTLDASGNLLVGATSPTNGRLNITAASGQTSIWATTNATGQDCYSFNCTATTASVYGIGLYSSASAANTAYLFRGYNSGSTLCFAVAGNGNVTNTNNSYAGISDRSLKENIVDATPKLADLLKVRIHNFNLIGDSTKQIGVVAQELEEIFPGMVEEDKDGIKSVKYSVFTPMLIKAIQELSAQNNALEARLAQLEAK
jgi:hypothetical protein